MLVGRRSFFKDRCTHTSNFKLDVTVSRARSVGLRVKGSELSSLRSQPRSSLGKLRRTLTDAQKTKQVIDQMVHERILSRVVVCPVRTYDFRDLCSFVFCLVRLGDKSQTMMASFCELVKLSHSCTTDVHLIYRVFCTGVVEPGFAHQNSHRMSTAWRVSGSAAIPIPRNCFRTLPSTATIMINRLVFHF